MFKKIFLISLIAMLPANSANAITFMDAADRKITLEKPAERVVILYDFVDYAAVAGPECYKRVVGIGKKAWHGWRNGIWSHYAKACPEIEKITDVGILRFGNFHMEQLVVVQPDIMILPLWQFEAISDVQKTQFEAMGVQLIVTDYARQDLETHIKSTMAIGYAIGKADRAKTISEFYRQQLDMVTQRLSENKKPFYYIEKGQKGALGQDETWSKVVWGAIADSAGGENIADGFVSAGKNGHLTAEKILTSDPEYIFITGSHWVNNSQSLSLGYNIDKANANKRLITFTQRLGWSEIRAIKQKHLYGIHHGLARSLLDFSAIQFIAKQFYPQAMKEIDPVANLMEFHEKFLPVAYQGTWFFKADY